MEKSPDKSKAKKKEDTKSKPSPVKNYSPSSKQIPKETQSPQKQIRYNFPSNVNEFRHIIEDLKCCSADIEFMLKLRRYKIIHNLNKNITMNEPSFYHEDYLNFKKKLERKKADEEKKMLKVNIGNYSHLFSDRAKYAINNPTFRFESRLRTEPNHLTRSVDRLKKIKEENEQSRNNESSTIPGEKRREKSLGTNPWNNSICPKERSLFDTLLPPILATSKEIFKKNDIRVSRPINRLNKIGEINGEKIKGRIFNFNSLTANRYPSDHFPSSPYTNDYSTKNVGVYKHLMDDDNRAMTTYWSSYLRGAKKKIMSTEEIKNRERKLKDRSHEKSYPK